MDSGHQAAVYGGRGGRSGGKTLKRRPIAARNTPYDRLTAPLQPENPNWLNAFVFPAKFVSGGAGKLLSSVWNPKSWGSCSSSSSSGSDSDSGIAFGSKLGFVWCENCCGYLGWIKVLIFVIFVI
ncbi:hypothetical protein HanPI659440_Chr03g0127841 [Helianthus annuus]|nr:hypothetical protein HanPI659440_Chr03g0127841 [Helianthus annuus]